MDSRKNSSYNLTAFVTALRSEGSADHTILNYASDLEDFSSWYLGTTGEELKPELVTSLDLAEYRQYLMRVREFKPATINRKMAAIRKWLDVARRQGLIDRVPEFPKGVARQKLAPRALERKEQNALIRAVERSGNARDEAIVKVLLFCGLRVSELVNLNLEDVELGEKSGKIRVRYGKGAKDREVPVKLEARKALAKYLSVRPHDPHCSKVFVGQRGPLTDRAVRKILEKYAYQAHIQDLSPHVLRHTCAKNLVDSGVDLVKVAAILGHESLDTTAVYTQPTFQDLENVVDRLGE
ncbi:tyrosine-type recombinase/integrase [Moorellaceae bacterium AZ2]